MSGIPAGAGQLLGKRLGKYEILALLALGGTAEIYLARIGGAAGFEKYVVVKCLHDHLADDQEFVKMFLDEARLAAHLDHSNIVQTMELGEHDNRYYMVMEFLAGLSLATVVRRAQERLPGGRIPVPLSLNIVAQACSGLHYAHERTVNGKLLNIVHRDMSPQNLVVSFEGVVKVVDFGIAKAEQRETKTRSGTIKGKFAYMSPEQCVANNVDRRTDVFALGVIAHELVTGKRLFKRASPYETYQAVIDCNVPPPSKLNHELDPALDALIMKALAKDKLQRYPTAEAFGDALLGYLHHRGKGSGPGDVARFFDASFAQEIDEHSARMRELISGRDVEVSKWDGEDEDPNKKNETLDLGGRGSEKAIPLDTADIVRPSASAIGGASDDDDLLDTDDPDEDDGDAPAEKTRIESNPLELLAEMNAASRPAAGKAPAKAPAAATAPAPAPVKERAPSIGGGPPKAAGKVGKETGPARAIGGKPLAPSGLSRALTAQPDEPAPATPPPPAAPAAPPPVVPPKLDDKPKISIRSGAPGPAAPAAPAAGKFPDRSNMKTQIADDVLAASPAASHATQPAAPLLPGRRPDAAELGTSPTMLHDAQSSLPPAPGGGAVGPVPGPGGPPPGRYPSPSQPPFPGSAAAANLPTGYPVMNPQLSQGMVSGGVFPSAPPGGGYGAPPEPPGGRPSIPSLAAAPARQLAEPAPSGSLPMPMPPHGAYGADLMSPVGQHYPQQVDWQQAAEAPARALPAWLMVVLFMGAIGVALAVTIAVARLAR